MFKSLKSKIHHKRDRSSSRMADSEEQRSREVAEPVVEPEAATAAPVERKEGEDVDGEDEEEKQSKRAMFGDLL